MPNQRSYAVCWNGTAPLSSRATFCNSLTGSTRARSANCGLPGLRHPTHERMIDFYGHRTIRCDGLPGNLQLFGNYVVATVDRNGRPFLRPNYGDYLLNTGQLFNRMLRESSSTTPGRRRLAGTAPPKTAFANRSHVCSNRFHAGKRRDPGRSGQSQVGTR